MSGISVERVGQRVLVTMTEPQWSTPLSLLLTVDVAAQLGSALVTMSSSLARDALDDRSLKASLFDSKSADATEKPQQQD